MIEGVNSDSLVKINTEKNCDKYDHFERTKPDDIYFLRLRSGPREYFKKTKEEIIDLIQSSIIYEDFNVINAEDWLLG